MSTSKDVTGISAPAGEERRVEGGGEGEQGERYLKDLGERIREARARRGMTRKILSRDSGVSERYLAQLESGAGNISILLLREIGRALDLPVETLVQAGGQASPELSHAVEFLRRMRPDDLKEAYKVLSDRFGNVDAGLRNQRIALIGLRGAGKSTLGALLAGRLEVPFIELDRMIELESGVGLNVIFDLYGQVGFRRLERQCLESIIEKWPRFVLATGGSLVSEHSTFERLLSMCFTIWLRATPEDHMRRVAAQGDTRPMAGSREAMSDLRRILAGRERLYAKADMEINTSERGMEESVEEMMGEMQRTRRACKETH